MYASPPSSEEGMKNSQVRDCDQVVVANFRQEFIDYSNDARTSPLLMLGDSLKVLRDIPNESVDCAITSPPYWGKRQYDGGGIGLESDFHTYISNLVSIFSEVKRVLKPTGSFWLNIGDSYKQKRLLGIPWRVALDMTDKQGWVIRNSVIWNKVKSGMDNSKDRLGNIHENIFHFVKDQSLYYYNVDAIRSKPRQAKVVNGSVISATGVSGVRYKRQIELSTALTEEEKLQALRALTEILSQVTDGTVSDFRMIIRGQQRTTHSDSTKLSGRAKELAQRGYYFLKYHPKGSKPADVWDILPEDTQKRDLHFAPFPEDLCRIPILATCPESGIVLDPFCGTGSALLAARNIGHKSVGIDLSESYLNYALRRCGTLL